MITRAEVTPAAAQRDDQAKSGEILVAPLRRCVSNLLLILPVSCSPVTSEGGTQKLCMAAFDASHFNQKLFINF